MKALLFFLQTSEDHFGAGDILFGIDEIFVKGIFAPCDSCNIQLFRSNDLSSHSRTLTLALVSIGVGKALGLTSLATEKAIKVGASLVLAASFNCVALGAPLHEDLFSSFDIGHFEGAITLNKKKSLVRKALKGNMPSTTTALVLFH